MSVYVFTLKNLWITNAVSFNASEITKSTAISDILAFIRSFSWSTIKNSLGKNSLSEISSAWRRDLNMLWARSTTGSDVAKRRYSGRIRSFTRNDLARLHNQQLIEVKPSFKLPLQRTVLLSANSLYLPSLQVPTSCSILINLSLYLSFLWTVYISVDYWVVSREKIKISRE